MSFLKRRGNRWFACFYASGVKKTITTGIPCSSPDASPARLRKLAAAAADAMERVAKSKTILARAVDSLRTLAREEGLSSPPASLEEYFRAHITNPQYKPILSSILSYFAAHSLTRIEDITPSHLTSYFAGFAGRLAFGTLKRYKTIVSSVFIAAVNDALLTRNPCAQAKLPEATSPPQERKAFSLPELRLLIASMPDPWPSAIKFTYFAGGLRLGDVCLLRWDAIDFDTGTISLLPHKTRKTGKKLLISLSPPLRSLLLDLPRSSCYVFPSLAADFTHSKAIPSRFFLSWVHKLGIASRVPSGARHFNELSFHSIRHTVVTQLRSAGGFSPDVVRSVVGHASESVERLYFHAPRDKQLEVYSYLADSLK